MTTDSWGGWGHMWGGGWGWLWGGLMMLFWVGLIALVVWLVTRAASGSRPAPPPERSGLDRARDILSERYARGEISTEEYRDRLTHLGQSG
ncbi:SHOCT domain-containing protein [Streptosporangium sp. NPDC000396]|uniref:SHOCT domain-containing protein n=1 Tax=Streptosporangium sp. NPDC000396 TaxID=3366185 RepID=UPI0036CC0CD1